MTIEKDARSRDPQATKQRERKEKSNPKEENAKKEGLSVGEN